MRLRTDKGDVGFTNLLLGQVIGKVGNHDLGLGRNAVSRGATLPALTSSTGLGLGMLALPVGGGLVSDVLQSLALRGSSALKVLSGSGALLEVLLVLGKCQLLFHILVDTRQLTSLPRPPRARPPRPRPARPRPRVDWRRRVPSPPEPSALAPSPFSFDSGLRASWTETLRSRISLPESSAMARSASLGVERSTKA